MVGGRSMCAVVALMIVLREVRRELASAGDMVVVVEGLTSLLPLLLLLYFWTCEPSLSSCASIKATRRPAVIALLDGRLRWHSVADCLM